MRNKCLSWMQRNVLLVHVKNIETNNLKISELSAIQTISTRGGEDSGSLGKLLQEAGVETTVSKDTYVYLVNGSTGYTISGGTENEEDFDTYLPTLQKMINHSK